MEKEQITLLDYYAVHCPPATSATATWGEIIKFKKLPDNARIELWKSEWTLEYFCYKRFEWAKAMLQARTTALAEK